MMKCKICGGESRVTNSRLMQFAGTGGVRRRRECVVCKRRFTTIEAMVWCGDEPTSPVERENVYARCLMNFKPYVHEIRGDLRDYCDKEAPMTSDDNPVHPRSRPSRRKEDSHDR